MLPTKSTTAITIPITPDPTWTQTRAGDIVIFSASIPLIWRKNGVAKGEPAPHPFPMRARMP